MTEIKRRQALAESLQDAIDNPARRAEAIRAANESARHMSNRRRRMVALGLLVISWGALAWLWLARPDWAFNPPLGTAVLTEQSEEDGLRFGMYLQAARIREFEAEHRRLPATIAEAGEAEEGLVYLVDGRRWALRGTAGGADLELTSEMSSEAFLRSDSGR